MEAAVRLPWITGTRAGPALVQRYVPFCRIVRAVRISLLGSFQVDDGSGEVVLGAAKERSLLASLALRPGSMVTVDELIAALWGDEPPRAARKTLQTYVWNLRRALGAHRIVSGPAGYALDIDADDVDVGRFRRLVRRGEQALRDGDVGVARRLLGDATVLWRGAPFASVPQHTGLANEAVRLGEEYLSALEARVAADLEDGRHAELVGELEAMVREHPYQEKLWGHLIVALYRCGRQADALEAYQRVRSVLVEELGLEPGGELRRLEVAVLEHDPALDAPAVSPWLCDGAVIRSPVRYARSTSGVSIAHQVSGDGPIDILAIPGFVSHLDLWWNAPTDRLVRRLTGIGRLITFDKRGMGLSDRPETVDQELWLDDAIAVLDAVGSERAVVLGVSAGAPTALLLAARHPERVRALVLQGGYARTIADADYEAGFDLGLLTSFADNLQRGWGSGVALSSYAPSRSGDAAFRAYWARYQQLSASPASAIRFFWAAINADVRDVLPSIDVPTLVVHAARDLIVPLPFGQYLASHIPRAELVVLDSDIHLICASDVIDELADHVAEFLARLPRGATDEVVVS